MRGYSFTLLLAALFVAACQFKVDTGPESCSVKEDCPADLVCKASSGECVTCTGDAHCSDGKLCDTAASKCVECLEDAQCDDGRCQPDSHKCVQCLEGADCLSGACDEANHTCTECAADGDCDDGDACTADACTGGQCLHTGLPDGVDCDTDNPCTAGACVDGDCKVEYMPDQTNCDDGDPCTKNDRCVSGNCIGMKLMDCNQEDKDKDGFTKAEGDCDDNDAAVNPNEPEKCGDNIDNNCNGQKDEGCEKTCEPADCNDNDDCTEDFCDNGVCHNQMKPGCGMECEPADCNDNDDCTDDWCDFGECRNDPIPGCGMNCDPPDCNDFNDCTKDWCQNGECVHQPIDECCLDLPEICNGVDDDCDGQVDEDGVCNGACAVVKNGDLGVCGLFLGYAFTGTSCQGISGCSCDPFCDEIFETLDICEEVCLGVTTACATPAEFAMVDLDGLLDNFDEHIGQKRTIQGFVHIGNKSCIDIAFCPVGCTANLFLAENPVAAFKKLLLQGDVNEPDGNVGKVECSSPDCNIEDGCFPFFPDEYVMLWGVPKYSAALKEHFDVYGYCGP